MNSKGHLIISGAKSILRIVGCIGTLVKHSVVFLVACFGIAEILGIAEELVDKR